MNGAASPAGAAAAGAVARLAGSYGLATADRIRDCLAGPCAGAVDILPQTLVKTGLLAPKALEILFEIAALEAAGDVEGVLRAATALRDPSTGPPIQRPPELAAALANPKARFGPYVLLGEIGRGGMGVVYRVWHLEQQRYFALKTMIAERADEQSRRRFVLEARTLGTLRHSNIIHVHDHGEADGQLYYAMDYIEGRSLGELVQKERPAWQAAAGLVAEASLAVHFAHTQGVVHRDIKPANILVDLAGRPFLVDFGLAHTANDLNLTMSGQIMGSPAWMAPEQMDGRIQDIDARSDIYALGGVLYYTLTGKKPYDGPNIFAIMQAVQTTTPELPSKSVPGLPPELDRLAMACLAKEPERRPQTAFEVATLLKGLLKPAAPTPAAAPAGGKGPLPDYFDALTRLFNRRHLLRELEARIPWKAPMGPVTLLLLDIDGFKKVNAKHGRESGDRALAHFAQVLRREAGPHALIGRHGGDSFLLALFGAERQEAIDFGDKMRAKLLEVSAGSMRLSGGVASFPQDADTMPLLMNAVNHALAAGKRLPEGGIVAHDRGTAAAAADASLYATLPCPRLVGRDREMAEAIGLFDDLCDGKPGLLHAKGDPGFGKTRFLREYAVRAQTAGILHLYVACDEPKSRVPAFPLLRFIDVYFEKHPVAEQALRGRLSPPRRAALREYVPAFSRWAPEAREIAAGERLRLLREAVETALGVMASESPLLLIVDNAGWIDGLTAEIAAAVLRERKLPLGLALATSEADVADVLKPLLTAAGPKTARLLPMAPLSYDDVEGLIAAVLPGAPLPEGFSETVAEASCGNPLYVEQLIRKLILDGKIHKAGGAWVVPPLAFGELPASLDAAVKEMIASLPPEAGNLITNAAVIGASFDFRALKAMAGVSEGEALDLMDQAEELGLLEKGDGHEVGFQAGHLREVRYRSLPDTQRQGLHQKAAKALVEVRGLSSGTAAFHSARGRGEPPPPRAEAVEIDPHQALPDDEPRFELLRRARVPEAKTPLAAPAAEAVWTLLGGLAYAVKTVKLYPGDIRRLEEARDKLLETARKTLTLVPHVTISVEAGKVLMNGQVPAVAPAGARQLTISLLAQALVGSLTMRQGLGTREASLLVKALAAPPPTDSAPPDLWEKLLAGADAKNIDVVQRRYVATDEEAGVAKAVVEDEERPLSADEIAMLWEWLRYLKATVDSRRLYPGGHKLVEEATETSVRNLKRLTESAGQLLLSTPEGEVVVNGATLEVRTHASIAVWIAKEFESKALRSVGVTRGVTTKEHNLLAGILAAADAAAAERLLRSPELEHIVFDARTYERVTGETIKRSRDPNAAFVAPGAGGGQLVEVQQRAMSLKESAESLLAMPPEDFLSLETENALPGLLASLAASTHVTLVGKLVDRASNFVKDPDEGRRRRAVAVVGRVLREAVAETQKAVLPSVQAFLEKAFGSEIDKPAMAAVVDVASTWLGAAGTAGQHDRIVFLLGSSLRRRPDLLEKAKAFQTAVNACLRLHEAFLIKAVRERMSEPDEPSGAAAMRTAVLFGPSMSPALFGYLRQVKDPALRKEAALAMALAGGTGAASLAALVRPGAPLDECLKVLSLIDLTGLPDVGAVAAAALGHEDETVRLAALALLRRAPRLVSVSSLRAVLKHELSQARIDALTIARDRKLRDLAGDVAALCLAADDEMVLRFGCYYFRDCPTPQSLPALRRIFELRSRSFGLRKGLSDETRAAAVEAVSRLDGPEAAALLREAGKDKSEAVKETVRRTRRFPGAT